MICGKTAGTHYDGLMEKPTSKRGLTQHTHASATGTLTGKGYIAGITAKRGYVVTYPLKSLNLVQQPVISLTCIKFFPPVCFCVY